jgi:hypothetical protein
MVALSFSRESPGSCARGLRIEVRQRDQVEPTSNPGAREIGEGSQDVRVREACGRYAKTRVELGCFGHGLLLSGTRP